MPSREDARAEPDAATLEVAILGDAFVHDAQIEGARREASYDFGKPDPEMTTAMSTSLTIATFEGAFGGAPHSGYPSFCTPDEFAQWLADASVDVISTASNHANDCGSGGLVRTLDVLEAAGLSHLGTYRCVEEQRTTHPLILERNGVRVALLSATYGTNGIPTVAPTVVNHIEDKREWRRALRSARDQGVDFTIALLHWGTEYRANPDGYQRSWALWLFRQGVDLIAGSHPHRVQPMAWWKTATGRDRIVAWSLGNYVCAQRRPHTDGGASLRVRLARDQAGSVRPVEVGYQLHWIQLEHDSTGRARYVPVHTDAAEFPAPFTSEWSAMHAFAATQRELLTQQNLSVSAWTGARGAGARRLPWRQAFRELASVAWWRIAQSAVSMRRFLKRGVRASPLGPKVASVRRWLRSVRG